MARPPSFPPLLKRKPGTAEARLWYGGRYYTCGTWDASTNRPSTDALAKWQRLVTLWTSNPAAIPDSTEGDIGDVLADWLADPDSPTDRATRNAVTQATKLLEEWRPEGCAANYFGVAELRSWQQWLCEVRTEDGKATRYGRRSVKKFVSLLRQAVRWAWPTGLHGVTAEQYLSLAAVPYPKEGRVREPVEVQPVPWETLQATAEHAYPHVRAILYTLWWTGARTDEILGLRKGPMPAGFVPAKGEAYLQTEGMLSIAKTAPVELGQVWAAHVKSKVKKRVRVVFFGPRAQAALRPILDATPPGEYLFRPHNGRPKKPGSLPRKSRAVEGCRPPRPRVTTDTLDHAVTTAAEKAGVTPWNVYRCRHAASQRIQAERGREAEIAVLGHGSGITRAYAGLDSTLAAKTALELG